MKDKTAVVLRIFLAVLLAISAVLFVIFYAKGEDFATTVMTWAYILLAITVIITIVFPIAFFIMNPKKGKSVLIALVGFVVLYFIAYSMSTGNISGEVYEKFDISEATSRFIGAMLYMSYIMGGLTILAIVYAGVSSLFK